MPMKAKMRFASRALNAEAVKVQNCTMTRVATTSAQR